MFNGLANMLMRLWPMALQFASVPLLVRAIGADQFGIYALYGTLSATLLVFDQGATTTILRESSRVVAESRSAIVAFRSLARVLELLSIGTGCFFGVLLVAAADPLAHGWLVRSGMPPGDIARAIQVMGLALICQWTGSFFAASFAGIQRQTALLPISLVHVTAMVGGNLAVANLTGDVVWMLAWQGMTWLVYVLTARWRLQSLLPGGRMGARPDWSALRNVWRFALGTTLVGMTAAVLTQADNLVVARYVSLDEFAAYALCFSVSSLLVAAGAGPVASVALPVLSRLHAAGDGEGLAQAYHRFAQVTAVLVIPMTGVLVAFPDAMLGLWLGRGSPLLYPMLQWLPLIAIGSLLNAFAMSLVTLQYAAGWTRLSVLKNLVAIPLFLLALFVAVPRFGPVAGAACWIAVNLGYCLLEAPLTHRRVLRGQLAGWWCQDVAGPILAGSVPFVLAHAWVAPDAPILARAAWAAAAAAASALLLLVLLPHTRELARQALARRRLA